MRRKEFAGAGGEEFFVEHEPGRHPVLSVVVPLYDEELIVPVLVERLVRVLDELAVDAEVILVDDGSSDGTLSAIAGAHAADRRFAGLSLSRNFGHQPAISAGLAEARGEVVVVMDGDLQDPPEAIAALWARHEGYDVVYAVRARRPEGWLKRLAYHVYYRILGSVASVAIPLDAGDFCIMSRRVVAHLNALPESRRFVRGLRAWVGFRQAGVTIDRAARHSGRPKFTLPRLVALAVDGLVGFSAAPSRQAAAVAAGGLLLSALGLGAAVARGLLGSPWPPGWAWVVLAVVFSGSIQLLFVAILGEYVSRIFQEVSGRPAYLIDRRIGLDPPGPRPAGSRRRQRSRSRAWE